MLASAGPLPPDIAVRVFLFRRFLPSLRFQIALTSLPVRLLESASFGAV